MITGKKRARRGTVLMLWSVPAVGVCLFFAGACTTPADPECVIDADCAANERCSAAGECILDDTPTNGEPDPECVIDADCGDDQVCNTNGVCIPDESGGPDPDPGEVECTTNSECNAGESCTPDGICVPDEGEAPCLLDSECNPDEVCTDAGFCADADDPDPPGPSDGGGGGGGGGGVPTLDCTTNSDCAVDEVCQNGLCAPAPEQPNAAELLEGCWRITFTAPGLGSSVAVYQFDADGRLERTWGVSTPGGRHDRRGAFHGAQRHIF